MGQIRGLLRGIAVATREDPGAVLDRVDEAMGALRVDTMATAVVARLEQTPEENDGGVTRLRWSNAGHPPPLVVVPPVAADHADVDGAGHCHGGDAREGETVLGLGPESQDSVTAHLLWGEVADPMLGLGGPGGRRDSVLTLPRGATLLLYTDGLVERRGERLDVGLERLRDVVLDLAREGLSLQETCDEVLRRMLPHRPDDDVALVAVRLHPEDRPRPPEAGPGTEIAGIRA